MLGLRRSLCVALSLTTLASCGSRTGLDAPPPSASADKGGLTAPPPAPDAGLFCDASLPTAYVLDLNGTIYTFDPSTLATTELGTPDCGASASQNGPWTLSVSLQGDAYVLYQDWNLYRVDLATMACTPTAFVPGQLGLSSGFGVAISRTPGVERLYVFGLPYVEVTPILAVSDLETFRLAQVGEPGAAVSSDLIAYDMQADLSGNLVVLDDDGDVETVNTATALVEARASSPFPDDEETWAVMSYEQVIYLFGDYQVARYDLGTNIVTRLGSIGTRAPVAGASAIPCYGAGS